MEERGGLGAFIRMQRELADLSLRKLAEAANVSNAYLSQVERDIYRPSAQVLKGIADALHLSVETLYARAGLLDEEPRPGVEDAIRRDDRLSAEQQETLIRVYRSFTGPS